MKRLRSELDQAKHQKRALNDDLQQVLARRKDIEQLQTTLVGLIQNSTSRKIDVDELKSKLAGSVRANKFNSDISNSVKHEKEAILGKTRDKSKGKSNASSMERTAKPQRYDGSDEAVIPGWYKALKKNL